MRIVFISSQDFKTYKVEAEYNNGKWTGNPGIKDQAERTAKVHDLDLTTEKGAREMELWFSGTYLWAKVVAPGWTLNQGSINAGNVPG